MSDQKNEQQEININVLIIVHKQSQFAAAASFLSRRGFPCTVKSNIRDGLQFITKQKATHVFLSWNLPGANIIKTYQLIAKTLKVECVVFAEKSDGKTAAELTMSRLPEVMQAPVSGPGLAMRLQKLIKAKEEGDKPVAEKTNHNYQQKPQRRTIKCSNQDVPKEGTWESAGVDPEDGQPIYRFKSSNSNGNDTGVYSFKGPRPPQMDKSGNWDSSTGAYRFESDVKEGSLKSQTINFQKSQSDLAAEENSDDVSDGSLNDISSLLEGLELDDVSEGNSGNENEIDLSSLENLEQTAEGDSPDEADGKSWKSQRSPKSYGSVLNVAKKLEKKEEELPEYEQTAPKEALILNIEPRVQANGPISILAEKVVEALKASTQAHTETPRKLGTVSEAKAYTIHSPRFNGYLLLASPNQIVLNTETYNNIKEQLQNLLDKVGEKLLNLQELDLDLKSIDFQIWAENNAEFVVSTIHNDSELVCAFIPTSQTLPKVRDEDAVMAKIHANDVVPDTKSKFNLYLHLPKNDKFIRYLRPGDKITEGHTDKFKKHSVDNLHIKPEEVQSFKEYFAANKLFDLTKKKAS